MTQSRRMSRVAAMANVVVGYGVAVAAHILVFPLSGLSASVADALVIGGVFTVTGVVRSHARRRLFEAPRTKRAAVNTGGP